MLSIMTLNSCEPSASFVCGMILPDRLMGVSSLPVVCTVLSAVITSVTGVTCSVRVPSAVETISAGEEESASVS